jgi:hypothetical protein
MRCYEEVLMLIFQALVVFLLIAIIVLLRKQIQIQDQQLTNNNSGIENELTKSGADISKLLTMISQFDAERIHFLIENINNILSHKFSADEDTYYEMGEARRLEHLTHIHIHEAVKDEMLRFMPPNKTFLHVWVHEVENRSLFNVECHLLDIVLGYTDPENSELVDYDKREEVNLFGSVKWFSNQPIGEQSIEVKVSGSKEGAIEGIDETMKFIEERLGAVGNPLDEGAFSHLEASAKDNIRMDITDIRESHFVKGIYLADTAFENIFDKLDRERQFREKVTAPEAD